MQQQPSYTFGKTERLKSRKTIEALFKSGKSVTASPLRIIWQKQTEASGILQAGVAVSTKHFKRAVDRNRIKRLMREAYRLQKNDLLALLHQQQQQLAVFILYMGKELPTHQFIMEKMVAALKILVKQLNEKDH